MNEKKTVTNAYGTTGKNLHKEQKELLVQNITTKQNLLKEEIIWPPNG